MATHAQTRDALYHSVLPDPIRRRYEAVIYDISGSRSRRAERIRSWIHHRATINTPTNRRRRSPELSVARLAVDEHGGLPGDCRLESLDWVPADKTQQAPYHVLPAANCGLGLIAATRTTEYRGSYKGWSSSATEFFLVGRNECGTFFAHRVVRCRTVREALDWMWRGYADRIVRRQGDIAIVRAAGPKGLQSLPSGHVIDGDYITHLTHPDIRVPGPGERIIVARRAARRGNGTIDHISD